MNKEILVLNTELSGANKYLFAELEKRGYRLTVINIPFPKVCRYWALFSTLTLNLREWKRRFYVKLEKLYKSPWTFISRSRYAQKRIKKLENKFHLILQISGMFSPYINYQKMKLPYVTLHDYTMALAKKYSEWSVENRNFKKWASLEKDLYSHAKLVFTTNENARQSIIKDYEIDPQKVIKVGCGLCIKNPPEFKKEFDGKTILFIGIDFERKGGLVLLEAFRSVKEAIPNARLLIVGPPKDRYSIQQDGVEFLGFIKDRIMIEDVFKMASLFVMPSLCEPFGLVYLEAMAFQLPCIGSNIDASKEIIIDGETGFLVNPGDANELAERIITLLNNPLLMTKMGSAGKTRVTANFNWPIVVGSIITSIEKL